MKRAVAMVFSLLLVGGFGGISDATPYYENYIGQQLLSEGSTAFFYFNLAIHNPGITNTTLVQQNDVAFGTPDLQSAFLRVCLVDDGGTSDGLEFATIKLDFWLDGKAPYNLYSGSLGFGDIPLSGNALRALEGWAGETLYVTATLNRSDRNYNDFIIKEVGIGAAPVPEPASMFLFGTGLIVFGFTGRKLKKR
jgi:hypothetical protein